MSYIYPSLRSAIYKATQIADKSDRPKIVFVFVLNCDQLKGEPIYIASDKAVPIFKRGEATQMGSANIFIAYKFYTIHVTESR